MSLSIWHYPTRMHFGAGSMDLVPNLCREMGIDRPLLVTDAGLVNMDFTRQLLSYCCVSGMSVALYSEVTGNPVGKQVNDGVLAFIENDCDGVIGIGGGSALDVAKTIAVIARQEQSLWELGGENYDWSWIPDEYITPLIALPTTAGTGSEVGRSSVIIEEASQSKKMIFHPKMLPPVVVSDPELTVGLPADITAATGIDAFVHCFEAYCAPGFHPMADGIALEGMRLVSEALPLAYRDGGNIEARGKMLVAASMGATAFQKDLGGVHALAHPLGAMYDIHHGLANAIILPYVMVANRSAIEDRMILPGRVLNLHCPDFDSLLAWILSFRQELGIPHTLEETGIPNNEATEVGLRAVADPSAGGNPVPFSAEQYRHIFLNAFQGRFDPLNQ